MGKNGYGARDQEHHYRALGPQAIAEIDKCKGALKGMETLAPEGLESLKRIATIESHNWLLHELPVDPRFQNPAAIVHNRRYIWEMRDALISSGQKVHGRPPTIPDTSSPISPE
jgi:hypothetical protein